ncbi:protease HtpX [Brackiella oedipodis]|uniref:protease HtpX n=1 Tax=Brackiella oedipodis TaxID=124225 RepID=UPI00048AE1D3|nr:protease HtpX [Brackiella oedipodis]
MKRIFLFLLTNIAVLLVISVILAVLGVGNYTSQYGIDYVNLLIMSAVIGFTGSIISLLMSKTIAKHSMGARVIDPQSPANASETWLLNTVSQLAQKAQVEMPEVAIYQGPPNAFATGAFKNSALVAVSTGLLNSMDEEEVCAVLAHEMSHVANGDMVTLSLIQGVVNTFVVFLSRIVAEFIDRALRSNSDSQGGGGTYFVCVLVLQTVFGFLASMIVAWFSRYREYRADAGAAHLMQSKTPMIKALQRLEQISSADNELPQEMNAFGITGKNIASLFASHPPLQERIEALKALEVTPLPK